MTSPQVRSHDVVRELAAFPAPERCTALQRRLCATLEREASWLADLPVPGAPVA